MTRSGKRAIVDFTERRPVAQFACLAALFNLFDRNSACEMARVK